MSSSRHAWLRAHPYLDPLARFQEIVQDAAARSPPRQLPEPRWERYTGDEAAGVPLLRSASVDLDLPGAAASALAQIATHVAEAPLAAPLARACRELREQLRGSREEPHRAMEWVVAGTEHEPRPPNAGLLRFLGWTAARGALAPAIAGAGGARWRDEQRWGRGYCPACGALPVSAQLVSADGGRARFLACGCCGTRWRYRRTGCPFCGETEPDRLGVLQVEGEEGLRLDVCEACSGYLKTYTDEGDEELFLADWPTLHLDVVALERGYRRLGTSLYDLPTDERRTS